MGPLSWVFLVLCGKDLTPWIFMEELGVGFSSPCQFQGNTPEVLRAPSAMFWVPAFPPPHPIGNTTSTMHSWTSVLVCVLLCGCWC